MSGAFSPFKKYFGGHARKKADNEVAELEKIMSDTPAVDDADLDVSGADLAGGEATKDQEAVAASDAPQEPSNTRVKTTFLGFEGVDDLMDMDDEPLDHGHSTHRNELMFPAGWVAIVDGPGRGHSFSIGYGVNAVGRSQEQPICLDFGDTSISREGHVFIAFDEDEEAFFVGHGGKSNLVRLNGKPLLSTEPLSNGDQIKVGQTVLRFVALCDDDFSWNADE